MSWRVSKAMVDQHYFDTSTPNLSPSLDRLAVPDAVLPVHKCASLTSCARAAPFDAWISGH